MAAANLVRGRFCEFVLGVFICRPVVYICVCVRHPAGEDIASFAFLLRIAPSRSAPISTNVPKPYVLSQDTRFAAPARLCLRPGSPPNYAFELLLWPGCQAAT